jgi:magnesium transporter
LFKVIDLIAEGKPQESEDQARIARPPEGTTRWVDIVEPDKAILELLQKRFEFHPLALDDCASFEMRSKLDDYDDHLFIVLHAFTAAPDDAGFIQVHELHAFLTERCLVTVHENPLAATELAWRKAAADPGLLRRGPAWALYVTVDAMIEGTLPVIEKLVERVEVVEERVLTGDAPTDLSDIFSIRSTLVTVRRVLRPVRDVIAVLTRRNDRPLSDRTALHFRDVQDQVLRCLETLEEAESLISNTIEANKAALTNRTNEIMAKLTLFSAIFLPLGFIVGFWGQNFHGLPFGSESLMWLLSFGLCSAVPVVLVLWFWWKGWI